MVEVKKETIYISDKRLWFLNSRNKNALKKYISIFKIKFAAAH